MRNPIFRLALGLSLILFVCASGNVTARELTFEERVNAQAAIERVYYAHQIGTTMPFEAAVPRAVLEAKVRKYLEQTAALDAYWKTKVTDEMLQRELERMAIGSRMPARLRELFAALGNDPFVVEECLARSILVDRLTRNFYAFDVTLHSETRGRAELLHRQLTTGEIGVTEEHSNRTVIELVVDESGAGSSRSDTATRQRLTSQQFREQLAELPERIEQVPDVKENDTAFAFQVVLSRTTTSVRVASYIVPKVTWDAWWAGARPSLHADSVTAVAAEAMELPSVMATPPCANDDTWNNGSLGVRQVTDPRLFHTAVWTGSAMIIWGGWIGINQTLNSGGRYDPATDSWTPTRIAGAPSSRANHTAIWTGSQMVIWGGTPNGSQIDVLQTGGRYDPVSDTWLPTSLVGAAAPRRDHIAVWTGSVMFVWGGNTLNGGRYNPVTDTWMSVNFTGAPIVDAFTPAVWTGSLVVIWSFSGGRYDPVLDVWTPIATAGAPARRAYHSAVWTGDRMVVWGGSTAFSPQEVSTNTGGRYDPVTNTWTAMSTTNAPGARRNHGAVWTGSRMLVWGGYVHESGLGDKYLDTGGSYDPAANTWTPTSPVGAPAARAYASAVWTGSLMVVWGGMNNGMAVFGGGRYDPSNDAWTPVSTEGRTAPRLQHTAVWTGNVMIVWGGYDAYTPILASGGRYDPSIDHWTPTSMTGAPAARRGHTALWTGNQMVIWGGDAHLAGVQNTGGRYDPLTDTWTPTSTANAPVRRTAHVAVWTGNLMIVWGGAGTDTSDTGGRYDPAADTWTPTSVLNAPLARSSPTAVWTGNEMIVWGGRGGSDPLTSGGRYDPDTDVWTATSETSAPTARSYYTSVWTGNEMIVWGGQANTRVNTGGRYDPASDTWTPTSTAAAPAARSLHSAVWTGSAMVVWGGVNSSAQFLNTGGRYDPATDTWLATSVTGVPVARYDHTAIWTGSFMLVWGGLGETNTLGSGGRYFLGATADDDGDGYSECAGDCDDADAARHPNAAELCNAIDDDCDGSVDDGADAACDDGDACTADSCGVNAHCVFMPIACNDGNGCTDDICDPSSGCVYTNNSLPCSDGDSCTEQDRCLNGACAAGAPVICTAADQCHGAGVCDPATGICSTPNAPDGSPCSDNDLCTSGDVCVSGVCTGESVPSRRPDPRTKGFYKKYCRDQRLTAEEAACVAEVAPLSFSELDTVSEVCAGLDGPNDAGHDSDRKACAKSEIELLVLALNVCTGRLCVNQAIDSDYGDNATVGESLAEADASFGALDSTKDVCKDAEKLCKEINNGRAIDLDSLYLDKVSGGGTRLTWTAPYLGDDQSVVRYEVWRSVRGMDVFEPIDTVSVATFTDFDSGSFDYEIVAEIREQRGGLE